MCKHEVERPWHTAEIERLDEQPAVSDLPAPAAAHEAPKLLLGRPSSPLGLLLEGAERSKVALGVDDTLDGVGTQRADQLVLQVGDAHVEAEPFHLRASEIGAEAGPLERALEVPFLADIAEAGELDAQPFRAELLQEPPNGLRAPDRHDGNTLGIEIPAATLSQRLDRALVADPFDEHDCVHNSHLRESSDRRNETSESGWVGSPYLWTKT